jgi:hypothetical protein
MAQSAKLQFLGSYWRVYDPETGETIFHTKTHMATELVGEVNRRGLTVFNPNLLLPEYSKLIINKGTE